MPMSEKNIIKYITDAIPDADVVLEDLKGDGDHYSATVKSKSFLGKTRVEQHKMVYDAFIGNLGSELMHLNLKQHRVINEYGPCF